VWHIALTHPHLFAAIVPVCGGIAKPPTATNVRQSPASIGEEDPYRFTARQLRGVPVWIFHGSDDPIIPVTESRRMSEELRAAGGNVRFTEYPGVGHNAWEKAYAESELWEWLWAQRLTGKKQE
jgi:predicted peptidase